MMEVGPLVDTFRTNIIELNKQNFIHNFQQHIQINNLQLVL